MKKTLLSAAFILFLGGRAALGAEYHGLVSVDNYYASDSSAAYDLNLLTTRLRLDVDKLNEAGTLSFHFDGRERNNLGSKDYSSSIKNERIDTLNLEYVGQSKRLFLSVGRLWPKEVAAERVDGINVAYQKGAAGIGFFGGLKPDPYTEEFNSDFTSAGVYAFYNKDDLTGSLALIHNGYKGGTDRQYVYGQSSWSPVTEVRMYAFITADINPETDDMHLTNAIAEVSYRPVNSSSISIGYNQFKAIRFYRSMDFEIVDTKQESYYVRGDHRFWNRYSIYGRYELRSQYYQLIEAEQRYSSTYQAGFRNDNLINSGITLDTNLTVDYSYSSTHNTYRMDLSRYFMDVLQLTVNGSYMESKYDINVYSDKISTYGVSGYLTLGKNWSLSLSYEGRQANDYNTNSLMSRVSYRF
jgi:hypothetical protein